MGRRGPKAQPFWAISPDGERTLEEDGVPSFARFHGLDTSAVYNCLSGQSGTHKGWRFSKANGEDVERVEPPPSAPIRKGARENVDAVRREIREAIDSLSTRQKSIDSGKEQAPPNWKPGESLKVHEARAKMHGLELKHIVDNRTEAEKFADAVEKLDAGLDSLWPELENLLNALESEYDKMLRYGDDYFRERNEKARDQESKIDPKAWAETVLKWIARLRLMRRVMDRARTDIDPMATELDRVISESVSLLRYMLFVMRPDKDTDQPGSIFLVGRHLVKMVVDLWVAENRCEWTPWGPRKPLEERHPDDWQARRIAAGIDYDGVMLMYPPRHSKTSVLRAWVCRRIARDQRTQGAYVHDMDEEAQKFNRYVQAAFDMNTDTGKRNYSLYKFELAGYDNAATTMRLQVDDPPKCPNLTCATVWSSKLGINLDWLIVDDVVPKKDQDQPTLRERRKQQFKRVWLTRFHGSRGFYIVAGYPWHHEDLVWDTYQEAKRWARSNGAAGQCLVVSKMAVGGPATSPQFYSIWPEMYPVKELRRRYMMMNDAAGWAANWMLNPITDDLRIVKRVRLYDPHAKEVREAIEGAVIHLSLDPAATNRAKSDKAGLVRAALCDVVARTPTEWGEQVETETMMLVLDAEEFHATQAEAADRMARIGSGSRVDYIHIEVAGGYGTSARDLLGAIHGVSSIIEHKPGMRNKEQRLRGVAPLVEDGSPGLRAKVAFPGVRGADGELVVDERVRQLVDYVVNFRVTTGHHSLDAFTQVCKHVAHELGAGEGAVTAEIHKAEAEKSNRIKKLYEDMQESEKRFADMGVMAWAEGMGA